MVDHVSAVLGVSSAGLWLLDDETREAALVRSTGYSENAVATIASLPIDGELRLPRSLRRRLLDIWTGR